MSARPIVRSGEERAARDRWQQVEAVLQPLYDKAFLLAHLVVRDGQDAELAEQFLIEPPAARAILDPLCIPGDGYLPGCHFVRAPIPGSTGEAEFWRRMCFCAGPTRVIVRFRQDVRAWERAFDALDRRIRKGLAPVFARGGTRADIAAACRAADRADVMRPDQRKRIAAEEAAWWLRMHATLPAEASHAA